MNFITSSDKIDNIFKDVIDKYTRRELVEWHIEEQFYSPLAKQLKEWAEFEPNRIKVNRLLKVARRIDYRWSR